MLRRAVDDGRANKRAIGVDNKENDDDAGANGDEDDNDDNALSDAPTALVRAFRDGVVFSARRSAMSVQVRAVVVGQPLRAAVSD